MLLVPLEVRGRMRVLGTVQLGFWVLQGLGRLKHSVVKSICLAGLMFDLGRGFSQHPGVPRGRFSLGAILMDSRLHLNSYRTRMTLALGRKNLNPLLCSMVQN